MNCPNGCGPVQKQEGDVWLCPACTAKWFIMQIPSVQEGRGRKVGRLVQLLHLFGEIKDRLNSDEVFIWLRGDYLGINIFYPDWRFTRLFNQDQVQQHIVTDELFIEGLIEDVKLEQAKRIASDMAVDRPLAN